MLLVQERNGWKTQETKKTQKTKNIGFWKGNKTD